MSVGTLVGVRLYASGSDNTSLGMATVDAGIDYTTRGRHNLSLLYVLAGAGVLIGVGVLVLICSQRWDRNFVRNHFGIALIGAASIATMSQVWPVPDSRHLWWGAALPILTLALWFSGDRRSTNSLILLLAVPLLFGGARGGVDHEELPRTPTRRRSSRVRACGHEGWAVVERTSRRRNDHRDAGGPTNNRWR